MLIRSRGIFVSLCLFWSLVVCAQTPSAPKTKWNQEPTAFRGIPWGTSEKEAKKLVPMVFCNTSQCIAPFSLGSVNVSTYLSFIKDRFVAVTASFKADGYETVKMAFMDKYGPPTSTANSTVQNRLNATLQQEELKWDGKTVYIELRRLGTDLTQGTFVIETQEYRATEEKNGSADKSKLKDAL